MHGDFNDESVWMKKAENEEYSEAARYVL